LRSALDQTRLPLEVLVCDNGSSDDTEARMRAWERRDARVRYLRAARNSGTPATTRNLGTEHARGELIAFLDDDDEWLADKLATQMAAGPADVVSSNALRHDNRLYFPDAPPTWRPSRTDILRLNPVIASSALVRRERLLAAGGFPTATRMRGIEDYGAWLALAQRGASFLVLGEPLVRYDDSGSDRLSNEGPRIQLAIARLTWSHALRGPITSTAVGAALGHSVDAGYAVYATARARLLHAGPVRAGSARN
jgi:hypothetical protein